MCVGCGGERPKREVESVGWLGMWRSLWIACQARWRGASRADLHLKKICPESANGVETGVLLGTFGAAGRWVGWCAHAAPGGDGRTENSRLIMVA